MEWPKVKTILIILLLAVNVFLFGAYASSALRQSGNEEQVRQEVCSVLGNLGYQLDPALLPADSQVYYPARITRDTRSERAAMAAALEQVSVENSIGVSRYTGKKGEVILRSGGYLDAQFTLTEAEAKPESAVKTVETKLKEMRVSISSVTAQVEEGVQVVRGICASSSLPIFNCRVECRIEGDKLSVIGRIPMGEVSFLQNIEPYAPSGLMLNFAEHLKSIGIESGTVEMIAPGYTLSSPTEFESGVTELVPVWNVRMSGQDWYINALTGKIVT